jgi:ATP-dependent Clp protease ATP-binding subunit ClpC
LNKHAEKVLKVTSLEAKVFRSDEIKPEHLMLSILKHDENIANRILSDFNVDYEAFKAELEYVRQELEGHAPDFMGQHHLILICR